ncbi:MAG: hypothetical protein Unbinned4585contig1001_40 [Prokaryotic dsDNA virus sp.]|nr:MAG: hypothetical protein Unbinned4585contig1001_40 [Prokaryotic dsDNA virus sp.]|tara:strand:+ start:5656 stop:6225 length:570 start_codon:yes stop_codon:yes gene_type:complete
MANYVLFISENKIKDSTALGGNIDNDFILPYLKIAQRKYIESKLGTDLFEALQTKITAGSLTGVYQTLVDDYIQDSLVHWGFYECLPFLRVRVSNNGIGVKVSETTESMTQEEMSSLREEIRNTAEFYTERMIDYLRHNSSSYPEYSTSSGSDVSPDTNAFYSGMNLEREKHRGGRITLDDFLTPDLNP